MKLYIEIKGDTNDADYITERTEINEQDLLDIQPVINAIKEFDEDESIKYQKYNWWDVESSREGEQYMSPYDRYVKSGKCTEEAYDYFNEYIPRHTNDNIHSIDSIKLIKVISKTVLL